MAKKVNFGLSNVYVSKRNESAGSVTYATPVAIEGAVSLTLSRSADKSTFYADNIAYFERFSNASREGELEVADIPDAFKLDYLGYKTTQGGKLAETNAQGGAFALLFQVETESTPKKYCIFNVKASENDSEHSTISENVEVQTKTLSLTMGGETVGSDQVYIVEVDDVTVAPAIPTF